MRSMTLALALVVAAAVAPCRAATLRTLAVLDAPTVRLADLFDDAGTNGARVLGPSPVLGGRAVVEAAQLAAIARQFGVDWRPLSLADRVVLDRPGRPLPRADVLDGVRAALVRAGAPEQSDLELPGFSPPLVPMEGAVQIVVSQVDYEASSGRFAAVLSVTSGAMDPLNLRVAGKVQETVEVAVTVNRLLAGTVLGPGDLRTARVRASLVRTEVARDPAQAVGMALRHGAGAGQPLPLADLMRPALVEKGSAVQMVLETQGIALAGQGQALDAGAAGDRVRVLNPVSRAVLEAEVTGPGRVRVRADSAPLVPAGRSVVAGR